MRILVMSDCHGAVNSARDALSTRKEAKEVIFLGDGAGRDRQAFFEFPDKKFSHRQGKLRFFRAPSRQSLS